MKMHLLAASACVLSMALPAPALASASASPLGAHAVQVARASHSEWKFMRTAGGLGQALIATGKLAQARGQDVATRRFGKAVAQESAAMLRELSLLSLLTQVPLPSRPNRQERKALRELKQLSTGAFDRAVGKHAGELLQRLVALLEQESAAGKDQALRALAREYLPALRDRLGEARSLADPATQP
ncbi:MAG TPA: DUF4142 domain-containing protein [Ramlibacter sp.]|uniref:DUF4142 domain-containing protein n=1 Tax=Ramlibacter sp. TaxID=1917967 RepID=UPI002D7F70C6|nr:DUF4142 domain-containing protein [Ramlibacter sp.]HET8745026.1 DUF4142 domain-containing protein [Ramlibacter sp.]